MSSSDLWEVAGRPTAVGSGLGQVFATAIEHIGEAVEIADAEGRLEYVNPAFERLTGYSWSEAVGRTPAEFLRSGQHDASYYDQIWSTVSSGQVWKGPMVSRAKDGTLLHQEATITPILAPDGTMLKVVVIKFDMTRRRTMEAELERADRLASLGRLAASVAHEINNPLAYAVANLDALTRDLSELIPRTGDPHADDAMSLLVESRAGLERVSDIVRSLKSYSRVDSSLRESVDVRDLVAGALRISSSSIRRQGQVVTDLLETWPVIGNAGQLGQAVLSLLLNAAEAADPGHSRPHEIRASTFNEGSQVVIEISDNGCGIDTQQLAHIFEPFFTTKPVGVGTGLGLPICRGIVEDHGGEIGVVSAPGVGSTFRITLPAIAAVAKPPERTAPPATLSRKRILVVDDEPGIGNALRRVLRGHDVSVATGATEALAACAEREWDAIFCDVLMPEMNGTELYHRVRCAHPGLERRMIFMTGGTFETATDAFFETVPNRRLAKPFDLVELHSALASVVTDPDS